MKWNLTQNCELNFDSVILLLMCYMSDEQLLSYTCIIVK